jgi:type III secretion system (T3SS) SseB-like protein
MDRGEAAVVVRAMHQEPAGDAISAAAAAIVDGAIGAVSRRRRVGSRTRPDVPIDRDLFDRQTLKDLGEFLQHVRRGVLTRREIVQEAGMWQQVLALGWPDDAADHPAVAQALDLLAALPEAELGPITLTPVEPVNDLERAMAATSRDESTRPALWRALHDGEIVLPVVAYELVRPEGANFQFLAAPVDETPLVLGFTTDERFETLLPDASKVSRVTPRGSDLARFWPAGHWLVINPGYDNQVVLSPWEVAGLPDGARSELPHPRSARIEPPDEGDNRLPALVQALAQVPEVDHVIWARAHPKRAVARTVPQDVLVVTAKPSRPHGEADEAAAAHALSARLPAGLFSRAVVVGRQMDQGHPFVEAVVDAGRVVDGTPGHAR